jgi:hypothetical protein
MLEKYCDQTSLRGCHNTSDLWVTLLENAEAINHS